MVLSLNPSPKSSLAGLEPIDIAFLTRDETIKQLDSYYGIVKRQILRYQSATTGLFPSQSTDKKYGSVRDSIFCASAVWALYQAYKRVDDDRGKSYELGQSSVLCMRGILACWMRQSKKLEQWKTSQDPKMALHSIFCLKTGQEIISTQEYNHLQLDCVSLYLLYLAQMITSGLEIIYSMEEVSLVQNLVYYVERAYRTPDFGMWGRGTKYNVGQPEVNATSIGIAKAALEAVNGFNLFGDKRGNFAIIYADIDAHDRNRSIFETLMPRGSNTKNTDASLLCTLSYPAFATHDPEIYIRAKHRMVRELDGQYGFKRYLGDGFGSEFEDAAKRYYATGETLEYESIENEWPIFFLFMVIDGMFKEDQKQVDSYQDKVDKLIIYDSNGDPVIPKMFFVPKSSVKDEKMAPNTQTRKPSNVNLVGQTSNLFLWGQSMFLISSLLTKNLLNLYDLDPIRRYMPSYNRPRPTARYSSFMRMVNRGSVHLEQVVQVVMIAETTRLQAMLANYGIQTQTPTEVEPVQIWPPSELVEVFKSMGSCEKLGLKGRPERPIGVLGTSKIYRVLGRTILCYPILFSGSDFYLSHDMALLTRDIRSTLKFIGRSWRMSGRPTFCILISEDNMRDPQFDVMLKLLSELKQGVCGGVKVRIGRLQNLISSACVEHLDLVLNEDNLEDFKRLKENKNLYAGYQSLTDIPKLAEIEEEYHDYAAEFKFVSTHEIVQVVTSLRNLYGQIQLYGILMHREGPEFRIGEQSVTKMLEGLIQEAERLRYWAALRYASSLLKRTVNSISPYATAIIVSGKSLTVGTIGIDVDIFQGPMAPHEITNAIYSKVFPHSVTGAVLQQEMILYAGKLIVTNRELFQGILVLRMGWVVRALELYKTFIEPKSQATLDNLPPSRIRDLLDALLRATAKQNTEEDEATSCLTEHQIKQLNGCLLRVPDNFYPSIWQILSKLRGGLRFGAERLPQLPTIKLHECNELSFYHLVEKHFNQYQSPCQRHLVIRTLTILAIVLKRNPEIQYHTEIAVEDLIKNALDLFEKYKEVTGEGTGEGSQEGAIEGAKKGAGEGKESQETQKGLDAFHRLSGRASDSYIGRAIVNTLLGGEIDHNTSCMIQ